MECGSIIYFISAAYFYHKNIIWYKFKDKKYKEIAINWCKEKNIEHEESVIADSIFIPQWFEIISIDYSKMTKKQRVREFMHIMDAIYNFSEYKDYLKLKINITKKCKENNCSIDYLHYDDYPEDIEW